MSEKYKTDADGLYFVTFTVVGWIDVFTRPEYQTILIDSIQFCQVHKNLRVYCYCILPSHVHLITYSENGEISNVLRDLKAHTARQLLKTIQENPRESRREWLLKQFEYHGGISAQKQETQFWKHDNHAFYLYSSRMIQQKVDYIHYNPVEAGFVNQPHEWRMSSANENGPIKLDERLDGLTLSNKGSWPSGG